VFLADIQLGCYASFSGMSEERLAVYRDRDMNVLPAPFTTGFEWDAAQYRRAVQVVNGLRPAFVMIGGDLVDDPNAQDQIDEFQRITAGIDDDIPVRWVPGNHDIAFDFKVPTPESIGAYRSVFGADHYGFVHDDWLFVALNTPVFDRPEHVPDELETQMSFLGDQLERAAHGGLQVVLIGHHPLFLESEDEPDNYWNIPNAQRKPIMDLIHSHDVKIGFAGHWHRNNQARAGGFTQVTSGPVGYPLGDDPSGYRVIDLDGTELRHRYEPLGPTETTQ
jgi:3',5'-cyclic AMP phosphodiesterase CpdA